ncbi:UPF0182 family protein [Oryzihumus sp.]|uniref:UPF0182 family membrane protein n=1 Tax=Oryzihumus sp. TaxID=1968903 RepID=UPI0039C8FCC7
MGVLVSHREWFDRGDDGGSGGSGRPASPPFRVRRPGPLGPTLAILVALVVLVILASQLWTEVLWFDSIGFERVFTTELTTKILLFVGGGLLTAGLVASSLVIAYRQRPVYAPVSPEQQNLDHYREMLDPVRKLGTVGIPVVLGLFAGSAAASQWQTWLLWANRVPFGRKDAQFGLDIGFFVFTLPWLRFLIGFLTMALVLATAAAALTHYVYGGLRLQGRGERTTTAARIHLSLLLAALVLVRAASYWLDRYSLTTQDSRLITGITYTDAHAVMPTKAILAVAAVMCAALFVATIWTKSWRLPIVGVSLLVVCAVVVGGIYPALVQSLKVKPSEKSLEAPYIDRNIKATREAYGLTTAQVQPYKAETTVSQGQLRNDADTIPGIRLVDPAMVSPTFKQLQAVKSYYQFPDALDVDRYTVDGKLNDTVIAVRELDLAGVPDSQRGWVNDHTVYTHGFGVVAAYGNKRGDDGQPVFFEQNIPPSGALGTFEPRVYFGESSPDYSIVGGPANGPKRELDYPDSSANGQQNTTYTGKGGVAIGSFLRQAAYAIKYRELKIMLSDTVNSQSRILDDRTPRERVQKVAPWLTLDGNPYPAVIDGRIQWIVDGYTTSSNYPYSRLQSIDNATSDSLTSRSTAVTALEQGQVNYIRNSVKATVDAYDGSVHLYAWDNQDPLLKAWSKAFPGTIEPMSAISGSLMAHLRYPEDLFKVQRLMLARYHVTDAGSFYGGQDFWRVPSDPTQEQKVVDQPPYYLSVAMPGQSSPAFSLTTTFMPQGDRQVLAGFMAVDSDAGSTTGQRRAGYGAMRLLELPRDTTVRGPGQVQNDIESSNIGSPRFTQTLSQFLSLNRQGGSHVDLGNLLTLPVGGGLLYVEPIYVSGTAGSSYPLSRVVVVAFGDKLAWSDTLTGALDGLFGGNAGAVAGDSGSGATTTPPSTGTGTGSSTALAKALADAQRAYAAGQDALKKGDFAAYGQAQKDLQDAIARAVAAQPKGGSVTVTPSPSATAKPSGSATGTG